ncbi:MAG: glutamyl-tRNA reductase [Pseudomonadota bacterium]
MAEPTPSHFTERLLIIGASHRTATQALRDRLMAEPIEPAPYLEDLRRAGIGEALLLATCDRFEIVTLTDDAAATGAELRALFSQWVEAAPELIDDQLVEHRGPAALRHLFAVAAALDSQLVGDPQVLGQVKESHRQARAAGLTGPALETALQVAYGAAKRVRSETPLAQGPVTLVACALQVARQLHGDLAGCRGLLIGLGELSELMAADLGEAGVAGITVVHGSAARSEAVARRIEGHFRPWEELLEALGEADIVVSAVGLGRYSLSAEQVEEVLRRRRRRPIFFIDTAVPSDIEPAVQELDGAFVYDLDDLEAVAREGRSGRAESERAAWRLVDQEIAALHRQAAERAAVPAVAHLRGHFEWVRDQVLAQGKLDAESATRLLIKRLLHGPSKTLRGMAAENRPEAEQMTEALAKLFPIDEPDKDKKDDET